METASDTGNIVMRKTTVLAAASAVVGSVIVIGFTLGLTRMVQHPAVTAAPSNLAEPELVTGAAGSQSISSSSSLSRRPAAFAAPTDSVRASADASPSAAPPNLSCKNPDALGVARVVEVDTAGGPGFGSEHFKQHDFLRDKEVVLTFDDGPWPTTKAVLKALAEECVRATFFAIGKHATYYPEILRSVAEAGHSVGSHTWSHEDLSKKSPDEAKDEIEKAISAVQWAL